MSLTVDLPQDLETQLRESASVAGVPVEEYVLNAIAERLKLSKDRLGSPAQLAQGESELLHEINQGLSEDQWMRYRELVARRDAEMLTSAEHQELKSLTDAVELANVQRLDAIVRLANLRQVSVDALMDELGIPDPGYA